MDATTPVNWEALDALVIDFAKSENLIEDSFASSSSPSSVHSSPSSSSSPSLSSSSYHSRLIIRQIRRSLECGDVDAAIDILRAHAPFILDDHRLLFRLHKQVRVSIIYLVVFWIFCLDSEKMRENYESTISCARYHSANATILFIQFSFDFFDSFRIEIICKLRFCSIWIFSTFPRNTSFWLNLSFCLINDGLIDFCFPNFGVEIYWTLEKRNFRGSWLCN